MSKIAYRASEWVVGPLEGTASFDDRRAAPGGRIAAVGDDLNEATVVWIEFDSLTDDSYGRVSQELLADTLESLDSDPSVFGVTVVRQGQIYLGPAHDAFELVVTAAAPIASGLAGAIAADIWKKARTAVSARTSRPDALTLLTLEEADHVARWALATQFRRVDWSSDLNTLFETVSETMDEHGHWTIEYRDTESTYLATVKRDSTSGPALVTRVQRRALANS